MGDMTAELGFRTASSEGKQSTGKEVVINCLASDVLEVLGLHQTATPPDHVSARWIPETNTTCMFLDTYRTRTC
eukprot:3372389-Pyramimonas_sp.AAC.1